MSPNEILVDLRRQPFEPFRLIVSDGTIYEIMHPDQCLVLMTAVIVPVRTQLGQQLANEYTKIDCRHIIRTQYLPASPTQPTTNGPASGQ